MIIGQLILVIAVLAAAVAQATLAVVGLLTATVVVGAVTAYVVARLALPAALVVARRHWSERRQHRDRAARHDETSGWTLDTAVVGTGPRRGYLGAGRG
jgi:hypothetical protein